MVQAEAILVHCALAMKQLAHVRLTGLEEAELAIYNACLVLTAILGLNALFCDAPRIVSGARGVFKSVVASFTMICFLDDLLDRIILVLKGFNELC